MKIYRKRNNIIRIALFFPSYGKLGGAERRLSRILSSINIQYDRIKPDIVIHCINNNLSIEKKYNEITNGINRILLFTSITKIILHFIRNKYDWVCYTDCHFRTFPAIVGALLAGSKRLLLNVNTKNSALMDKNVIYKFAYRIVIAISNRLDCLYPSSTKILKDKYPNKIITNTPGSFTDYLKYQPSFPKRNIIVFAGRFIETKNPILFAKAVVLSKKDIINNEYKCVMCGDGELKEEVENIFSEGGCSNIVDIIGNVDLSKIFSFSKIYCSLQNINNYPSQALLEALSCGNYCIVTNEGDSNLLVRESFGELIENDPQVLAQAIKKAMQYSLRDYENIAREARLFVTNNFTIDKSVKHYYEMFLQ